MLSPDSRPAVVISALRQCATDFYEKNGRTPALREVAETLGYSTEYCRTIVSRARKDTPVSWTELGIQSGLVTRERALLAEFERSVSSDRAKMAVVYKVLELVDSRFCSSQQARVLVHAITTGEAYFDKLDKRYAEMCRIDPHRVSDLLHSYHRRTAGRRGIIRELQDDIVNGAKSTKTGDPYQQRSREFIARCIELFRTSAERKLFSTFLEGAAASPDVARIVAEAVNSVTGEFWPKAYAIGASHFTLARALVEQKKDGRFQNLTQFAKEQELDLSGIHRALSGKGTYLGIGARVLGGAEKLDLGDRDRLESALGRLRKEKQLDEKDAKIILDTLDAIERAQSVLTETEKITLKAVVEQKIKLGVVRQDQLAESLGLSGVTVHMALKGREGAGGGIAAMNSAMASLDPAMRRKFLDNYFPYDIGAYPHLLRQVARFKPSDEKEAQLKERLIATLEGMVLEKETLKLPMISQRDSATILNRRLQLYEGGALIRSYFGRCLGKREQVRSDLTISLQSRTEIRISEKRLRVFLDGKKGESTKVDGGIRKMLSAVEPFLTEIEALGQKDDTKPLKEGEFPAFLSQPKLLGWAGRIVQEKEPRERIRLCGVYCASRPHTARELVNQVWLARRFSSAADTHFYMNLRSQLTSSSLLITDSRFVVCLKGAEESAAQKGSGSISLSPFLIAGYQRRVDPEHISALFENIVNKREWASGLEMIEEAARLAYGSGKSSLTVQERLLIRRAYRGFLERKFGDVLILPEYENDLHSFAKILELAEEKKRFMSENDMKVSHWVESFYKKYAVEAVIRKYCGHLIQSPGNYRGLPYGAALDAAHGAVMEAARRYTPDLYAAQGKPVAAFSTYAVMMIRWGVLREAKAHDRDLKRTPIHLEDHVKGGKSEDTLVGSLIAIEEAVEDVELQARAEETLKGLDLLDPVAKRIMELRFGLDTEDAKSEQRSLQEVAQVLHEEGLTDRVLSREYIRQVVEASLINLRTQACSGTPEEWNSFFEEIETRSTPAPFMTRATTSEIEVSEDVVFGVQKSELGKRIMFDVERVFHQSGRDYEVIVRSSDAETLEPLGMYEIVVSRGCVVSCERIE